MQAILTDRLSKSYGEVKALDRVSLAVEEGELFGLLGMNGAGKTTLIKILTGLCKMESGEGFILGKSVRSELEKVRPLVGISPQETAVANKLTVEENLRFFADIYGVNLDKIEQLKEEFSLHSVWKKRAKTLSGGYARRLSIACALATNPKVLFLDEPTLGLDVLARRELWEVIESLKGKITVVLTSHYLEEIEHLCDRVGILSKGKLLALDSVENIKKRTGMNCFEEAFVRVVKEGI